MPAKLIELDFQHIYVVIFLLHLYAALSNNQGLGI